MKSLRATWAAWWLVPVYYALGVNLLPLHAAQQADPRRPAAITVQEVPVVPAEILEKLSQYQDIRAASFAGWAPDGKGVLIRTRFGNSSQLHRVYRPGGRREQWTFFNEPVEGMFIPKATDNSLLLSMSHGGNENDQLYLLDRNTLQTTLLTDGTSRNLLGPVRRDGKQMIVHSNQRNGRDTDIYRADCRQADSMEMLLQTDGQYWTATDWSVDGRYLLMRRYVSINESYPGVFDLDRKKLQPLPLPGSETADCRQASVGSLVFSSQGRCVYLTTDAQGEFLKLARLDLDSLHYTPLAETIDWDVSDVVVEPESGLVAFSVNEAGASRLYLLKDQGPQSLELPLGIVSGLEFSSDGKHLGFTLSRPDAPSDAYTLRLDDGKLTRWTYSETGGLDPARFVRPTRFEYSTFDERKIPGFYFKPAGANQAAPLPVLINIHGGPESQYRPGFSGLTQYFVNELGIAVIYPNVRGSAGYGKTYLKLDNAQRREDSVKDIGALLDWIEQQPELDASRVAVMGGSYGGYMVLASLMHYSDRIRAGIDIVGIANFITFLQRTSPYRQDLRRAEYGDERDAAMRAIFDRINPAAHAERIRSALLVAHGTNDPRVPFLEAQQIAEKVRAAGRPVWTVYADNEGHGFSKKANDDYLTSVEVLFLIQHLQLKP